MCVALTTGVAGQVPVNNDSRPAVSPDGARVAFQSTREGSSDLYWMPADGGWPRRVTRDGGNNRNVAWSPSGERLAFESDRSGTWQLYVQSLDDSVATQVTDIADGASEPVFFPDGKALAFIALADSVRQVHKLDLPTGTVSRLTRSPGNKSEPALSASGDRLAFLSDATGGLEIVVSAIDGSQERRITSFAEKEKRRFVNGLGWTPDGRLIFAANRRVRGRYFFSTDIYTLGADGTELRGVLRGIHTHNNPSMARDGSVIAFDSFRFGGADVFVVRPDGSALRNLTATTEQNFFARPTPDGERVVFQSEREGQRDLYIMDRDGSDVHNLTRHPEDDRAPSISRDGNTVAFASFRHSSWGDLYTMDLDGGNVSRVTPDGFFEELNQFPVRTSITPNGDAILFEAVPILVEGDAHWDIWRIERDGSEAKRLTHSPGTVRAAGPEVSPDGKTFLYFSNQTGDYEIYRMPIEGGTPVRLTDSPGVDEVPTWSPAGDAIYFTSRRDGQRETYRMSSDGSDVERITYGAPEAYHYGGRLDPAGRNLWVLSNSGGGTHIHRLQPDGTGEVRLTAPWGPTPADPAMSEACGGFSRLGQPHWSWARNEIVFPGDCNGDARSIYVYSVADDTLRRLRVGVEDPDSPAWSYAGDRIAFNGRDETGSRDLYMYHLDSGLTERVTEGGAWGGWVTWSPDDRWLNGYGPNDEGTWDIFRLKIRGGERVRVNNLQDGDYYTVAESPRGGAFLYSHGNRLWRMTDEWSPEPAAKGNLAAVMPRWAPDARRYVFDGFEGFGWNLYIGDWRLGRPVRLTQRAQRDTNATWSPDGKRVVYVCSLGDVATLCIVDVATRRSLPLFLPDD